MKVQFLLNLAVAFCLVTWLFETPVHAQNASKLTTAEVKALVDFHNKVRRDAKIQVAVKWDTDLAKFAQEWADTLAREDKFEHRPNNKFGENIAYTTGGDAVAVGAKLWADEKSLYMGEAIDDKNFIKFGHYTQMIWNKTTTIGAGKATSASGKTYVVCNYSPPGNLIGSRPDSEAKASPQKPKGNENGHE